MLLGIDPLLTGALLARLDEMGHYDTVAVVDAHFPAHRLGVRVLDHPGTSAPQLVRAICTVLALEPGAELALMAAPQDHQVQQDLIDATGATEGQMLTPEEFYDRSTGAYLVVRTGELRTYGNALLTKGVTA